MIMNFKYLLQTNLNIFNILNLLTYKLKLSKFAQILVEITWFKNCGSLTNEIR